MDIPDCYLIICSDFFFISNVIPMCVMFYLFIGLRPIQECNFCSNDVRNHITIHYCSVFKMTLKLCYDCHKTHVKIVNKIYFAGGRNGKCVVCGILLKDEEPFHRCSLHPNCHVIVMESRGHYNKYEYFNNNYVNFIR